MRYPYGAQHFAIRVAHGIGGHRHRNPATDRHHEFRNIVAEFTVAPQTFGDAVRLTPAAGEKLAQVHAYQFGRARAEEIVPPLAAGSYCRVDAESEHCIG